MDQFQHV